VSIDAWSIPMSLPAPSSPTAPAADLLADLEGLNARLEAMEAEQRVAWALAHGPAEAALSSSFGAQSAVALHMLVQQKPDIPVILIDTGYLFPETYRFADELTQQLQLNLKVYRPLVSRAWMEARHGRLWEQGLVGIEQYNNLRRAQASSRAVTPVAQQRNGRLKISPIADWSDRDVWQYLKRHRLPYHPLWHEGYVSIGDFHTTSRWEPGMRDEDTRFFGIKRECGIHEEI
jgi:phosphoadenosine phosphosulfate reductase